MNNGLTELFKDYLDVLRLKKKLDNKASDLGYKSLTLINNEVKNVCGLYKEEINSLCELDPAKRFVINDESTLEDKLLILFRIWGEFSYIYRKIISPEFKSGMNILIDENRVLRKKIHEKYTNNDSFKDLSLIIFNYIKHNENYEFIGSTDERLDLESKVSNNESKGVVEALAAIIFAKPEFDDYYFIFNEKTDISDLKELRNSDLEYIKIKPWVMVDEFDFNNLVNYNVPMPVELKDFLGEINFKKYERKNVDWCSDLTMFFAIYLNVHDKEGTFFKPENYDVDEIKKTYELLK